MKKSIGKLGTILIILVTVILAGVAIFTALRLYQLRQQSVAPNVPSSQPKAVTNCTTEVMPCPPGADKEFARRVPPDCEFESCYTTNNCILEVTQCPDGTWVPRIPPECNFAPCAGSCLIGFTLSTQTSSPTPTATATSTSSPTSTPTGSPGASATPTPTPGKTVTPAPAATPTAPALPVSGTDWPTIFGVGIGLFVIIGSLLLAL